MQPLRVLVTDGDNRATLTGPAEEICRGETSL